MMTRPDSPSHSAAECILPPTARRLSSVTAYTSPARLATFAGTKSYRLPQQCIMLLGCKPVYSETGRMEIPVVSVHNRSAGRVRTTCIIVGRVPQLRRIAAIGLKYAHVAHVGDAVCHDLVRQRAAACQERGRMSVF